MNRNSNDLWRQIWYLMYTAGLAVILVFWWLGTGHTTTAQAESIYLALGNTTGLLGAYLILWQIVLLGRLTLLENVFGLEKLTWLHKWNGYTALTLILAHTWFLMVGYAIVDHSNPLHQLVDFMFNWNDVLKASLGTALLIFIVFISIGIVRRLFKYETWYYVHIFTYLAILLAFSHQLSVGSDFEGRPGFVAFWDALYIAAAALLVWFRFWIPTYLVVRHQLRVEKVVDEAPGVISIYFTGYRLNKLHFKAGQFFIWRFLDRERWWQAHPFSLSAAPNGKYLRVTVKQVGDFTQRLSKLMPGTLVSIDGPHGNFTPDYRIRGNRVLLIAGGVGVTPIRSMLEALPPMADVVLLYAARKQSDLALRAEIDQIAARNHVPVRYVLSGDTTPGFSHGHIDKDNLAKLVPDVTSREVMLCGPPPMMNAVTHNLVAAGVPSANIHTERFAY